VRLERQVAIVTGAGRGVGRAVAEALAAEGAAVALASRTERELDAIGGKVGRSIEVETDVTDAAAVQRLVERTERELGPATLLVAAAGSWSHVGPLWEGDPQAWWQDVEVTLRGTFLCARAVLPGMIERGAGRIVALSSYAANGPRPYSSGYASGKAALLRLCDSLAAEVAEYGISVFAVTPGFVRTKLVEDVASPAAGRRWLPELAEREDALPADRIAGLVVELATGRADALSGRFLHVLDDLDDLVARADEISNEDGYALRFRR
jgi:NAD(P)-dependent dehydrogenase (short-subunit alcohol dehydrogenase family)